MKVKIYGKENCKFCQKAKELALDNGYQLEYVDIKEHDITVDELCNICGDEVSTVPQIFLDGVYNPGGYTGFRDYVNSLATEELDFEDTEL